jgi:hypothetical protein
MWKELIEALYPDHEFRSGAAHPALARAEEQLGARLPADLRSLLAESDGVFGAYGLGLVWPTDRIASDNLRFRSQPEVRDNYESFESLLFFGDAGNGDQFAFPIAQGVVRSTDVFVWNHEE